jgi:mannose-6-phosphate isomerase-like protein (cupin superfamily)
MNIDRVKGELRQQYPESNIKENVDENGEISEVVAEIDRRLVDSDLDVAVVVADKSQEHYHLYTKEIYKIIKGSLRVFLKGEPTDLGPGETITIEPGVKHRVEGDETWFYCLGGAASPERGLKSVCQGPRQGFQRRRLPGSPGRWD